MFQDDLMKKWAPILGSIGVTGSQLEDLSKLAENQSNQILNEGLSDFQSILPIATKIAAQTICSNLVSVQPMSGLSQEEIERINSDIKKENRDGKIDSLIDGKEYKEMKPEDHPDWNSFPKGKLFYMDFKYGSHKKTRRAGKKNKKKNV
jgi:hypothetical protein